MFVNELPRSPDFYRLSTIPVSQRDLRELSCRSLTRSSGFLAQQFLLSKSQWTQSAKLIVALADHIKEVSMEYLILIAVVSMMALYGLIIARCLKQPEW